MQNGKWPVILAATLVIVAIGVQVLVNAGSPEGEPLKTAEALSALPDDQLENAVLHELGRDTYREGSPPDAWRRMRVEARHLWSVAAIKDIDPITGLAGWLRRCRSGGTTPGPRDMRDGLTAMGLDTARQVMDEICQTGETADDATLGALHKRLIKEMNDKLAIAIRRAWVRRNLHDLLGR